MKEVNTFRYLRVDFASNGRMDAELNHRSREVRKCAGVLKSVWKNRNVSMETKRGMYEGIVVPTALYGSEAWVLETKVKSRMDASLLPYSYDSILHPFSHLKRNPLSDTERYLLLPYNLLFHFYTQITLLTRVRHFYHFTLSNIDL